MPEVPMALWALSVCLSVFHAAGSLPCPGPLFSSPSAWGPLFWLLSSLPSVTLVCYCGVCGVWLGPRI